jgi:glucosamine-phosphate N-acetyltransferase
MTIKLIQDLESEKQILAIFSLLQQLTSAPTIDINLYNNIISDISNNIYHSIFVYTKYNKPVGMITLLIEQKLIHGGSCIAHIEDLVVDKKYNGQGIATKLLNHVINIANNNNCYKIILDCKRELIPFYEKTGFKMRGNPSNPLATLEIRNINLI